MAMAGGDEIKCGSVRVGNYQRKYASMWDVSICITNSNAVAHNSYTISTAATT